jgi:formamidopyrimidine-DNA glycosylase
MPELPEVETLRRGLAARIVGRRLGRVEVRDARLRSRATPAALRASLQGRTVRAVERRAKYLLVHLSGRQVLVVHLGMSGQLVLADPAAPLQPHTHVRIGVGGAGELRYTDPRRFGMLFVVPRSRLAAHPRFANLGPEPLATDFSAGYLLERSRRVRKPIKNFLMDAAVVVGVGNIYACEALYRARIHPTTPAGRLSAERWHRLRRAVRAVLQAALRAGGTTLKDFRDAAGGSGMFQHRLDVYDRSGHPCRRCRRTIRRIVQAGRSTYYCPGCQH